MQSGTQIEQVQLRPKVTLSSLNGGRGLAAIMVFMGHSLAMQFATQITAGSADAADPEGGATDAFFFKVFAWFVPVPINYFFVLSGFVLAWIYRPGQTASGFWLKRLGKVYPAYFFTSLVAFVLWGVLGHSWTSWKIVLTHVFLLQGWTPDQNYLYGLNVVMWTLSNEVFLYLLFPGLILMLTQFSKRGLQVMALACVGLSFLLPQVAGRTLTLLDPRVNAPLEGFDNGFIYWFTLMFPPMRMFQFVLGMCVALLMLRGARRVPSIPVALVIFVVGLTLTNMYLPVEMRNLSGMLVPIAILIAALTNADLKGKRSPFKLRPLVFLGKISYSFYAVHILFILFTILHVPVASGAWDYPRLWLYRAGVIADPKEPLPGFANIGLFVLYLSLTIVAAWFIHTFIEQPISRWVRSRVRHLDAPKKPPAEEPVPELAVSAVSR